MKQRLDWAGQEQRYIVFCTSVSGSFRFSQDRARRIMFYDHADF